LEMGLTVHYRAVGVGVNSELEHGGEWSPAEGINGVQLPVRNPLRLLLSHPMTGRDPFHGACPASPGTTRVSQVTM